MSRKENALDLAKFVDKGVRVKLSGGREGIVKTASFDNTVCDTPLKLSVLAVQGTLKGYDQLLNLVMDETIEYLRGQLACVLQT